MASLNQVTLELKVTGERQATKALKDFAEAGNKVGTSLAEVGRKVSSIEGELKSLVDLNRRKVITDRELAEAQEKHARALAALTGRTVDQSRAALESMVNAKKKEEADRRAAQAAEQLARAQRNLEGSVLKQSRAVDQAVSRMEELSRLQAKGAVGSRDMAQAEIEIARALARTNGYLKSNGDLNTQKALAEMRAAQTTRDAAEETRRQAAADAAAAANKKRLEQSYDQLLASINPTIAAQQRMRQTQKMLRDAVAAGAITASQAAAALRQYQAAAQAAGAAGQMAARRTNQLGVLFQQTGYQVGDFAVQVQSGTDFMVALGQQATQLVGTFAMLSRSTRNIAIFSALGVAVPILTAVGAGFTRSGEAANIFADIVENRLGSLEPVFRGLGNLAKLLSDAFEPLGRVSVENLDRLLVAGTLVAGFFAGKFIASTNLATAAVGRLRTGITALGISIQLAGVRATAAMVAMGALTAVLTRIVLPLAAVYAATEGVMFVIRQFRKEAEDASQTDLESTLERLAKGGIEVDKVMDALNDSVSAYRDATDDALQTNEELTESFGRQASAMERLFEQRRKLAEIEARGAAADALNIGLAIDDRSVQRFIGNVDKISENYDKLKTAIGGDDDISPTRDRRLFALSQQVTKFAETLNLTKIGALEFAGAIKSAQEAAASGDTERMANAVQNLYDTLNAALLPGAELSEQMRSYLQSLVGGEIILREFLALQEESADATGRSADELIRQVTHQMQIATLQKEINDGANEIVASRDAELQRLENQTRINNLILKHGEDSNQVTEAKLALERKIFKAKQIENNILGKNLTLVMDAYDAYVASQTAVDNVADSTGAAANNASSLANEMSRAASEALRFVANLGSGAGLAAAQARVAGLRAELGARQSGAGDVAAAEARARAQAMADPRTQAALQGPVGLRQETLSRIETEVETARLGAIAGQISSQISALGQDTGGTSGAGAAGPNIAEEFERLKRSIDDAYEASQKFKESKDVLDRAMASGVIKTTEEYNRLLGLLREEYDLTSEKGDTFADNMMKIANTARDALGDAFMSIVDGTKSAKDAFADMARIILKQAFELLVIKPILDGIFGGLTGGGGGGFLSFLVNANGNAFSGGNVIPFANGGVVGGPTAFPMSGGRMGLMGEAGPEAIMPLKRGKGGKLGVVAEGSSQPVVINQSFNFQANGDESVKRIIAQEAPKIANLTQKQVLEARSRGGAFRTTFGA